MTGLSLYRVLFMTELLAAEWLLFPHLPKRPHFIIRVILSLLVCYAVAFAYPLIDGISYTSWYVSLMFVFFFAVTFITFHCCFRVSWSNSFFCTVSAYTVQHFTYGIVTLIFSFTDFINTSILYGDDAIDFYAFDSWTLLSALIYLDIFILIYWLSYIILKPRLKRVEGLKLKNFKLLFFAALIFIVDIILNAFVIYESDESVRIYSLYIYNILCCIFVFYMQMSLIDKKDRDIEVEQISEALRQAHKQYALRKENINLINMKCHDLKYQINHFANKGGMDRDTILEIERMISIYDASIQTGNEVLDIILTEKSLICCDKQIKLTCIVDYPEFDFISEGDLYALFGNIVDNSIEAVLKISDETRRCISIMVRSVRHFVSIKVMNYYIGEVEFTDDGLPQTTKADKDNHGYGMRSISAIAEKYGGFMCAETNQDIFSLTIMFPLPFNGKKPSENEVKN